MKHIHRHRLPPLFRTVVTNSVPAKPTNSMTRNKRRVQKKKKEIIFLPWKNAFFELNSSFHWPQRNNIEARYQSTRAPRLILDVSGHECSIFPSPIKKPL